MPSYYFMSQSPIKQYFVSYLSEIFNLYLFMGNQPNTNFQLIVTQLHKFWPGFMIKALYWWSHGGNCFRREQCDSLSPITFVKTGLRISTSRLSDYHSTCVSFGLILPLYVTWISPTSIYKLFTIISKISAYQVKVIVPYCIYYKWCMWAVFSKTIWPFTGNVKDRKTVVSLRKWVFLPRLRLYLSSRKLVTKGRPKTFPVSSEALILLHSLEQQCLREEAWHVRKVPERSKHNAVSRRKRRERTRGGRVMWSWASQDTLPVCMNHKSTQTTVIYA